MSPNTTVGSSFDLRAPLRARVGRETPVVDAGRGSPQLSCDGRSTAGEGIGPRPKRLVPILHEFRIRSERAESQLSLFENLNGPEIAEEFSTIPGVRQIDPTDETPVVPFDEDDDPTTEFVRSALQRAFATRGHLHKLEKRSGISSGYFTKLLKDKDRVMRVGIDFVRKFAPALGYDDMGDFFFAVGKWWEETGRAMVRQYKAPETIEDVELRRAVEATKGLASPEVVKKVMSDFRDQVGKRDQWWWVQQMIDEAKADFRRQGEQRVAKKQVEQTRREIREARKAAPESSRTLAGEAPPAAPSSAAKLGGVKKRRAGVKG